MVSYKVWLPCIAGLCLAFCCVITIGRPKDIPAFQPLFSDLPVVMIDAGHGGEDGGAVSLTGAYESHINLSIAKRLDCALTLLGYPTVMLRSDDVSLHDDTAVTIRQKKVSDLKNRVRTVTESDNTVLISVHQNSYPGSQYHGAQVFYHDDAQSQQLAKAVQQALILYVDPNNKREIKQVPDSVYLFKHITCTAILVECGFLTNPQEEQLLRNKTYQNKLAAAIASAFLQSNR